MRTVTAAHEAVLASGEQASRIKVEINDGASWIDLGNLYGLNWVTKITYGETTQGKMMDAVVTVKTRDHDLSISPLATNSLINATNVLLASNNSVRISAAVMPSHCDAATSDYFYVFKGEIDKVAIGPEETKISCLGLGKDLADAFVESERTYGTAAGRPVEDVIQDILTDWGGGVTLYSITGTAGTPFQAGDSPGWNIVAHPDRPQRREPVLDAIRNLGIQIGYEVRYIWNSSTSDFQLTLFEPDRALAVPHRTFTPSQYLTLGDVAIDRQWVRNFVLGSYVNSDGRIKTVSATDAASVAKLGRLWMEIASPRGDNIDSSTEAQALVDAALADLKDPTASMRAATCYFPWFELGDLIRWEANGSQLDSDLDVAVAGIRHTIDQSGARTEVDCRGTPYAAMERWKADQATYPKSAIDTRNLKMGSTGQSAANLDFGFWGGK
jgi:hypothetical protein